MSGNGVRNKCKPETIVRDHPHKHSLICSHKAFFDEARKRVVYLEGDTFHENCDDGHTHRAPVCLKHEFTKVARKDEDCSKRKDCHAHILEDGTAEIHHPPEGNSKNKKCRVVNILRPLT